MSLNDDQISWVKYLATLPRDAKCRCGWYRQGQCPKPECKELPPQTTGDRQA